MSLDAINAISLYQGSKSAPTNYYPKAPIEQVGLISQGAKTYQAEKNPFAPTSFQGSLQQELNEVYQIGAGKNTANGLGGFGGETETTAHKLSTYA